MKRALTEASMARSLAREAIGSEIDYRDALKTPLEETTDPLYREVIALHNSLLPRQQKVLARLARQGFIDGVSTVLGILDGASGLSGYGSVDFELTLRGTKKKLNGGIQDYFLEAIELSEGPR